MKTRCTVAGRVLVAVVLIAGCIQTQPAGGPAGPATETPISNASTAVSAVRPAVLILDPPFDGGVAAGTVTVTVRVTDFALVPPGGPDTAGAGHLVYYRDVAPGTVPGERALTAPGTCVASVETAYAWDGVAPGTHTFAVQLVNADDTPLEPPALDAVDVTAVSPGMIKAG
jgi:hypothetical protein